MQESQQGSQRVGLGSQVYAFAASSPRTVTMQQGRFPFVASANWPTGETKHSFIAAQILLFPGEPLVGDASPGGSLLTAGTAKAQAPLMF